MILVDADRLTKSERAPVWGPIWLECPELEAFPEQGWYDILTPILTAWINALVGLDQRSKRMATVHFMDGPFRVIMKLNGASVCIELFRNTLEGDVSRGMCTRDLSWLLTSAIAEGAKLLHELRVRGWDGDDDADALRTAITQGRTVMRRLAIT